MKLFAGDSPEETTEFRRYRSDPNIFTKLSLPISASYACGNNSLNYFLSATNASNDSYRFSGIQVSALLYFFFLLKSKTGVNVYIISFLCLGCPLSWLGI